MRFTTFNQFMLTHQLRELEQHRLVTRTVYPVVPPKVEYALTELGFSLEKVLYALRDWGRRHAQGILEGDD